VSFGEKGHAFVQTHACCGSLFLGSALPPLYPLPFSPFLCCADQPASLARCCFLLVPVLFLRILRERNGAFASVGLVFIRTFRPLDSFAASLPRSRPLNFATILSLLSSLLCMAWPREVSLGHMKQLIRAKPLTQRLVWSRGPS